jgi:hypothetical protein
MLKEKTYADNLLQRTHLGDSASNTAILTEKYLDINKHLNQNYADV